MKIKISMVGPQVELRPDHQLVWPRNASIIDMVWMDCAEAGAAALSVDPVRTTLARARHARHAPFRRKHF